jgi:hypothetical protein
MRKTVMVLALVALGGCDGLTGASDYAAYVRIEGGLRPDAVVWYYPPEGGRHDGEHPAECINAGCSLWGVPAEASGDAYVSARWSRPVSGSTDCTFSAYDASPIAASTDTPQLVVLHLERHETCP